ncbi:TadA family conjugal transfer-associated ATPase [Lysobacter korlensis]|uniref:TadA family conjugal transfer-associated ATPase n=1 Tax=Lysobacter korlensis TaxID=553636 RepID=A0ABV6S1F6_9GAMM
MPAAPFVPVRAGAGASAPDAPLDDPHAGEPRGFARNATGFGPLSSLVADPAVTDVLVNSPEVWLDSGDGLVRASIRIPEDRARDLAVRLVQLGGRHLDEASPCVDVRLHDGIRVHAVLPPISPSGTLISIRLPRLGRWSLDHLEQQGMLTAQQRRELTELVEVRENVLVTGGAGAGKTTLLAALLSAAAPTERIVVVEDVAELRVDHPHTVSLEARQPNIEGAGGVSLEELVRQALRMRPDRLVVGECRGPEVRELLTALNTGSAGGAGTVHANSLQDVPARLEALGALAGLGAEALARQAVSAVGTVLHLEHASGSRRLVAVGRLRLNRRDRLEVQRRELG